MDPADRSIRVLFVCLGNICRSPMAEGIFGHIVEEAGLEERVGIDSAGTSAYHTGESPDERATETAARRGIALEGRSRQVTHEDVERFDYLIAMDAQNREDVEELVEAAGSETEVRLLREFDPQDDRTEGDLEVPDPYFGGPQGFERVHDLVERSCRGLLEHIRREKGL